MEKSRAHSALGGKKDHKESKDHKSKGHDKKSKSKDEKKKHAHRLHISRTDNGKFLVDHEFKHDPLAGEEPMPGQSHAIDPHELASHVTDSLGIGGIPSPDQEPLPAVPAAPAVSAPAVPAPAAPLPVGPVGV